MMNEERRELCRNENVENIKWIRLKCVADSVIFFFYMLSIKAFCGALVCQKSVALCGWCSCEHDASYNGQGI